VGRSRGGFTTKIHLACEQGQNVMSLLLTAGQRGDSPQFQNVLDKINVPRMYEQAAVRYEASLHIAIINDCRN
jgi:hypothetical protein